MIDSICSIINEEDYLSISGIQHFAFCRRQWALINIEQQWEDNLRTIDGALLHERAHDPLFTEKRKDMIITHDMSIISRAMGVVGKCDVVEFQRDDANGIELFGRAGRWCPYPVEYKRGSPKITDIDRLQLCAQVMCIEEMLVCKEIDIAYLFYWEIRRREAVAITNELRSKVLSSFTEMHEFYKRGYTPRAKRTKSCNACSLKDICLPELPTTDQSVDAYLRKYLSDSTDLGSVFEKTA